MCCVQMAIAEEASKTNNFVSIDELSLKAATANGYE